ncbi:DNA-directed primase/polymerase protein [Strongyloides ratti]|uniref:DNA-directed primase/polymerase protein n=1 Tax=Strongyloides ratti TaxID=34506 RepID=A0A090LA71_STRRB|nr:DNA-directed primase/polymerase protein [Strongyloides ratti]CEF66632.1 DNA-directed primase/polymerase protein [Strongyloides ratti]
MTSLTDKEVQLHFKSYYHQNEVMDIFMKNKKKLRVFSYENPTSKSSGSRKYIITSLSKFTKWYLNTKSEIRNFYEIIPLDAPCRLYFDLEYSKEINPEADSKELFNNFCLTVKNFLMSEYNIELNIDETFLILESSTPTKFSKHVIIHLPEQKLFSSNIEMKKFTDFLYITMLEKNICLVYNGKTNNVGEKIKVPIFDNAVYTKNRNFRLYLSCKLGKNTYLKLSDECKFYQYKNILNPTNERIFFDSLCVPRFYYKYKTLPEYTLNEEIIKVKIPKAKSIGKALLYNMCKINNDYCDYLKSGYGRTSAFILLEEFIVNKNKEYVITADIRAWDIIRIKKTGKIRIIYHIKDCRYCFQIKREHKSNHVYWEVYFDPNLICHQKCFDRECNGRSSIGIEIPHNIAEEVVDVLKEMGLYQAPYDSFADSFWNMERDNISFLNSEEIEKEIREEYIVKESRKRSRQEGDFFTPPTFKFPKILDENNYTSTVSEKMEDSDFVVIDGKVDNKNKDNLKAIVNNPEPTHYGTHQFSVINQANFNENCENQFQQDKNNQNSNMPVTNKHLSHISSCSTSEEDPLNDAFFNSTLSSTNDSSIINPDANLFTLIKKNTKNICVTDKSGNEQTILETSYDTDNSFKLS